LQHFFLAHVVARKVHRMGHKCSVPDLIPTLCKHGDFRGPCITSDEEVGDLHFTSEHDIGEVCCSKQTRFGERGQLLHHVKDMLVPQGGVYSGQVTGDDQPHGIGSQRWSDGTVYTGSWAVGTAHGLGQLIKRDGSSYDGLWSEGRKHGSGCELLADGSEYRGEFSDGQKHGHGTFRWEGSASYTGQFCEDMLQGDGDFVWSDGRIYRGQWVQSRMHGQGRFEWPDGKCFEGRYDCDKKHGPGVFNWPDGSKVVGVWQAGKQHGIGTHIDASGVSRKGRWNTGNVEQWFDARGSQPLTPGDANSLTGLDLCGRAAQVQEVLGAAPQTTCDPAD